MSQLMSRRNFLKVIGVAGGGLVLGISLSDSSSEPFPYSKKQAFQPNAFLQITADNQIHFYLPRVEMGQGTMTGLTTLVAEELEVEVESIQVRHAGVHADYTNPEMGMQGTGGSSSMKVSYYPIRQAAANAREMIRVAAAQQLGAPADQLELRDGQVHWQGKARPYGAFVDIASTLPVPEAILKQPEQFTQIGREIPRLDGLAKATGTAEYGIDVEIPNLYRAALLRCPVIGGKVKQVNSAAAESMPGVKRIVTIFNGVAVVADSYWQARKAVELLQVEWDLPALASHSSESIQRDFVDALENNPGEEASKEGEGADALMSAISVIKADYSVPFLAHAPMEPLNCTVKLEQGSCEIWVGTQIADITQAVAAEFAGIDKDQVKVHTTFLGGGFGRRSNQDNVAEAVSIAKFTGLAIQLVWSREDEIRNGCYRPASMARFQAGVDSNGKIEAWSVKRVGPNIIPYILDEGANMIIPEFLPDSFMGWARKRGYGLFEDWVVDPSSVEGLCDDYDVANKEVRHVTVDPGLRVGFWRSVAHSYSGFFKESFMDEVAHATGQDPVAIRLAHTENNPRLNKVIENAAREANWGHTLAPNRFQGIAAQYAFNTYVAEVAEVSVENGRIIVRRVTCVVDCGRAINPDIVKAQMEGGIIFGMTAALHGNIILKDGAVQQSNFHDYPMVRMNESPEIDVHIIDSHEDPSGVGEPGVPPIAPAIANAVFAATGKRLRQLPLRLG